MSIRATGVTGAMALTLILSAAGPLSADWGSGETYAQVGQVQHPGPIRQTPRGALIQAIAAAEKESPNGEVLEAEVKNKNGIPVYAVEIVPADSKPKALDDESAYERAALEHAQFKLKDAIAIAEQAVPGKAIDAEIDNEKGTLTYIVEIERNGVQTVGIDVHTGRVVSVKAAGPDDADDANEALDGDDDSDD